MLLQGWNAEIAKVWFPANCVFVGMLWSSFPALQLLGVAMVTVLKNMTNLFVISGDIYFYGKRYNAGTRSLALLVLALTQTHVASTTFLSWIATTTHRNAWIQAQSNPELLAAVGCRLLHPLRRHLDFRHRCVGHAGADDALSGVRRRDRPVVQPERLHLAARKLRLHGWVLTYVERSHGQGDGPSQVLSLCKAQCLYVCELRCC